MYVRLHRSIWQDRTARTVWAIPQTYVEGEAIPQTLGTWKPAHEKKGEKTIIVRLPSNTSWDLIEDLAKCHV